MNKHSDRRNLMKQALAASTGAALTFGFEEKVLLARADASADAPRVASPRKDLPMGKIGEVQISRLICGGNLISGFAHSRDLIYLSSVLRHYFTDDKVLETFRICEENGINTAILRLDPDTERIISKYWRERDGNLQWIAQIKPKESDLTSDAKRAVDLGAIGVYIQGESGDALVRNGRVDAIGKVIEFIKHQGVIAGIGAHEIAAVKACVQAGFKPDFYMKTFNSKSYWSAGPALRHDNVWEDTPEETEAFMKTLDTPWIAFKVLGAGAIAPDEGFKYAFERGADFICVGMFDFQVAEDAEIARRLLAGDLKRERAWKS